MSKEKSSIVLVVVIILSVTILAAIIFSFLTYQSYVTNSNEIQDISEQNIRNTALAKAADLSHLTVNKLNSVIGSLELVSSSPNMREQDIEEAKILLAKAQNSTEDVVDSYYWFDSNGTSIWSSSFENDTIEDRFNGFSIASYTYFKEVRDTLSPVYGDTQEWVDLEPKIFIIYPILDSENATATESNSNQIFKGVVLATINPTVLGELLENQLSPLTNANISLVNSNGLMILKGTPEYFGINLLDPTAKSLSEQFVTDVNNENNLIEEIRSALLNSRTFSIEVVASDQDLTVAYSPVLLDGKRLLTIILALPHIPEASVENLVLLQRNFGLAAMITIGIISFGVFYGVTNWHKEMRKQVQKHKMELEQTAEKLAIIDQGQKEFIDIAAHEFRTPIQSVLGYSEFIRSSLGNFDDYFDNLFKNAKRLEKITNDILDVSKIDSENFELSKTDFDLTEVIKKTVSNHEKDASDRNVKIIFEQKKEEAKTINADESKILQVIDNLLSNALDFTKDGTITMKVYDLSIRSDDKENNDTQESVAIEVKDTGSGINEEIMPRLFEKFSRRSDSGAGLGLYISKKIVDMHGGKFWAQNNRGTKGATFTFTLPTKEKTM
ncbi:MAG TPA: sensor histidine kinase [Nitrososphaeraceae archaeon]|nr:sensor histidine kinase [Nitrososphaeraceae archaeon]